jgi:hypothetical protein
MTGPSAESPVVALRHVGGDVAAGEGPDPGSGFDHECL